jgi:DNA replication protein DnaC
MSSGSYFPPPVKAVPIPKKSGGIRILGVPTVADRVAQTVVKMVLEPMLEPVFDRERLEQENRSITTRLRRARLAQQAAIEDVDLRAGRGLDRAQFTALATCSWVAHHHNLLICGPTGVGKSWLACAFGHKACREGYSVLYQRLGRLFTELSTARGEGRYLRLLKTLAQVELLILDDWGLVALSGDQLRDLLEILEDRHGRKSTLITSQLPIEHWHEWLVEATLADAIMDRLIHNAYKIKLKGDSLRKNLSKSLDLH